MVRFLASVAIAVAYCLKSYAKGLSRTSSFDDDPLSVGRSQSGGAGASWIRFVGVLCLLPRDGLRGGRDDEELL